MSERFLRRSLSSAWHGDVFVLDCLRWAGPFGSNLRMYVSGLSKGVLPNAVGGSEFDVTERGKIGEGTLVLGRAGEGAGPVAYQEDSLALTIQTSAPETAPFDDLDVMLAMRHGQSADEIATWLQAHVDAHQINGAVIFDRADTDQEFAGRLEELTANVALNRVMVVNAPLPLGALGRPASRDTALAPRPKSRDFTPDPWQSRLADPVLFDILRWRFLSRAASVIALDPSDHLDATVEGTPALEAIHQSHTGMVQLSGDVIYPWRVRKGAAPMRHDHICRSEPATRAPDRWAVSPKRLSSSAIWLTNRIIGVPVVPDEELSYLRAASLCFPKAEIAELVNKDLLVLDKSLLEAAQNAGHKPILPPTRPKKAAMPAATQSSGRTVVVTCMKNEGPFILEWIAYHRMIGVDDFLVYTNDCDDGTVRLLDLLQARGILQRRNNPFKETGGKPQQSALDAARGEALVQEASWVLSMDVDEYINVHVGAGRLPDLYASVGDAALISMTWRLFGNADIAKFEDRPITEQFARCAPHLIRRPHQAWGFKTLFRNQGLFDGIGVHRPRGYRGAPRQALWVNGSGQPMPERMFKTGWRSEIRTYGYDLVTLNHYACRSVESFLVKRDRGRVNHVARDQGEAYWFRMNNNDEQDLSIQRHARGLREELATLMADTELAEAHQTCVAKHQSKIAMLKKDPEYKALYDRLTGDRLRRLSRMHRHFGMNVFLAGPSVIPDKVLDDDLPENFFFNTAPPASNG